MNLTMRMCDFSICCLCMVGCQSPPPVELGDLVQRPPLPYSILVTGGAFLSGGVADDPSPLRNTFSDAEQPAGEPLSLDQVVRVLREARVFVNSESDPSDAGFRAHLAGLSDPFDMGQEPERNFLARARGGGADYLLVIQGLRDGRIADRGTNDRWPWTFALWLVFGIGAVIPDHSFETAASMRVSLREVQTGRIVSGTTRDFSGGPLDLSLFSRGNSMWWLKMILVPPFWIGSDEREVARLMRRSASQRLLFSMARYLKDASLIEALREDQVAHAELRRVDSGLEFVISARQSLSYIRLRMNRQELRGEAFEGFEDKILASETLENGSYVYRAVLPLPLHLGQLQVLMQTVGGGIATSTSDLGDL